MYIQNIEDDGFITMHVTTPQKYGPDYFDEFLEYKGFALVNEVFEDDDCRKNYYQWGRCINGYIIDPKELEGLSSRSYASFGEVWDVFTISVENILKESQNNG